MIKLKRYWVFSYSTYYPSGGMNDFVGSFETVEDARQCAISRSSAAWGSSDNFHIFDTQTFTILCAEQSELSGDTVPDAAEYIQDGIIQWQLDREKKE